MWESDLIKRLQNIIQDYEEIIVVLSFAILLGFINGIVDAQMLGGTYFQNMFQPNFYQILERLVFIIVSLFFGVIWHRLNKRRKENEREIRISEMKYRTLAKTATDGIILTDESKKIAFVNRAAESIFGYTQDEILGEDVKILIPDEYKKRHDAGLKSYLETGKPKIIGKTVELEGLKKSGKKFPIELSLSVSKLDSGSFFTAIIRDITERKKLEQDLVDYTMQLEDLNQQKELFTDIMRHDLINPIGIILNVVELIEDNDSSEDMQEELEMIKRNANKVYEMIESASKYAKLKSVDELELMDSDLSDIITDSIEDLKNLADEKKIMIESNLEGSYPVKVNPFIDDVFSNLISNAIKYSPENSKILIDSREDKEDYIISVKDFGEGISDENKENIFHRFERAPKEGTKGFGLGLAIVKMIVDMHNGRVWVEDNPEGGCIFYVGIPKAK